MIRRPPNQKPLTLPGLDSTRPLPVVAIIGRPNVGKSTLFNRILGTRLAIVDDIPGVTRDRNYAECTYQTHTFQVVDTGGLDPTASEGMVSLIRRQAETAVAEAHILLFVMDGKAGLTPLDQEIVQVLRGVNKPVFFAVNKIDSRKSESLLADFFELGEEFLYPISAEQGIGVDELLEAFLPLLPEQEVEDTGSRVPRLAVVGRPNTGKSTLINTILGEERVLVSATPGTTRDPVDTHVNVGGHQYIFTDTAGIRRRGRIERGVEGYSLARTIKAVGRSDIAILLLDAVEGVTEQDTKIAGLILKQGRGCVLFVNKWDLRKGEGDAQMLYSNTLHRRFPFLSFAPIIFASAFKPKTTVRLFPIIDKVMAAFQRRIPTAKLNQFLQQAVTENPFPVKRGNPIKSVYITQVATTPPTFALFVGQSVKVESHYLRYLENRLRDKFGFLGTPIRILIRPK